MSKPQQIQSLLDRAEKLREIATDDGISVNRGTAMEYLAATLRSLAILTTGGQATPS